MRTLISEEQELDNEKRLLAAFIQLGIARVNVEFDGSGDSGQIDSIHFGNAEGSMVVDHAIKVWVPGATAFDTGKKEWVTGPVREVEISLEDAVKGYVDRKLDESGVDWYNNDGGYGHWDWTPDGIDFEIHRRYTDSNLAHSENRQLGESEDQE